MSGEGPETVLAEQLHDLLINEGCSCARTAAHPCPRCAVSIEQARELLRGFTGEVGRKRLPVRIHRQRVRGWRMPAGAIYVGRPTRWGNPYTPAGDPTFTLYRNRLACLIAVGRLDLEELRGHDLACWCRLDRPCHADVLLELANPPAPALELIGGWSFTTAQILEVGRELLHLLAPHALPGDTPDVALERFLPRRKERDGKPL